MQTEEKKWKAVLASLILGLGVGWVANGMSPDFDVDGDGFVNGEALNLTLFWNVLDKIQEEYIDMEKIDKQAQIYGATSGLVNSLGDPYSSFFTPEESKEFQIGLNGELDGIGAELSLENNQVIVISPLKNSPAAQAGLLPGDFIVAVDGLDVAEMSFIEVIKAVRGEAGTKVTLTIFRAGMDDVFDMEITRAHIEMPSVELAFIEEGDKTFANIMLNQFGDDTANEFRAAIREITLKGVDGAILDMRRNGGGYLEVSIEILSEFFEDEVKAVIVKKRNEENEIMYTRGNGELSTVPLVVLIDEGSASASEIVAGALQDFERAKLIGQRSFGKGSVQELLELYDNSTLRLTTAKWYTPKDRSIEDEGVMPDLLVEMPPENLHTDKDNQLEAAVEFLLESLSS